MKPAVKISVIIPTYNEGENIAALIRYLNAHNAGHTEIIVSDGQSTDNTVAAATGLDATIVISPVRGRAAQMNYGASFAQANILYFLHADSLPPPKFASLIADQVNRNYSSGCFRLQFDHANWFLQVNAWFTRFNYNAFRFGDQSLFVLKDVFTKAGGFKNNLIIMEDQEIIHRLKKYGKFIVLPETIITSARKYTVNGIYKMQAIFFLIYFLYKTGVSQHKLRDLYRKLIKQDKV